MNADTEREIRWQAPPGQTFLHCQGMRLTFGQVSRLAAAAAEFLRAHCHLRRGDRVAILLPNDTQHVIAFLALMRMGVAAAPLNTRLTKAELGWQIKNADCRLLIVNDETAALARALDVPALTLPALSIPLAPPEASGRRFCDAAADADEDGRVEFGTAQADDLCAVIHTSGTTGAPKAAVLTHGNFYFSARASAARLGRIETDRWLCVLPLYHVGGLSVVLRSLLYGTAVELARFDVDATNRALSEQPITLVSLVPTMLGRLLDAKTRAWNPRLRLILLGGEAPSPRLLQRCQAESLPIAVSYGLTEAASQAATAMPDLVARKPGTAGKALPGTEVKIVDERGESLDGGALGEVLIQGPTVARSYFGDAEATRRAFCGGWLRTGDMGYMDDDGDLFILQRRADLIISGGENIYPAEVEAALRQHDAVDEALVFGAPDADWGQRVLALVECGADADLSAEVLDVFLRARLAGYKIPRQYAFVRALPRTATGKLKRGDAAAAFAHATHSPS